MKAIRDTWLIYQRSMLTTLRQPVWVMVGLFQPICQLLLFGPLLDKIANAPGFPPGGAINVFAPGVLVMLGMFNAAFVGFGLIADLRAGVVERLRVTPVSRVALLLGRAFRDVTLLLVQGIILLVVAVMMGLSASWPGVILTLVLISIMGLMTAAVSYAIALILKSEDSLAPLLNFFTIPLLLLSGITLPLSLAPEWIQNAAKVNPFAHATDASRALFGGRLDDGSVFLGFGIMIVLAVLALTWASRTFREANA
jgi:ABC-2 type transport system permease protein